MKVIYSLAKKNLKQNKKRTIATSIGIIFSVMLICFISTLLVSFQSSMLTYIKETIGNYHIMVVNTNAEEVELIKNKKEQAGIQSIAISQTIGAADYETKRDSKLGIQVEAYDDLALQNRAIKLLEGRLPENKNEIVISDFLVSNANENLTVGTKITLNVEKVKVSDKYKDLLEPDGEEKATYTIVGISKQTNEEAENQRAYIAITKLEKIEEQRPYIITILMNNINNADAFGNVLQETIGNVSVNDSLLMWQGAQTELMDKKQIELLGLAIIIVVTCISILLIRNSFRMSILERKKDFGTLASIGATSKQIKKSVILEGIIYACISIPIGIILGIGIVLIGISGINAISVEKGFTLQFVFSPITILVSVIISIITIYISCIKPAKDASKVAPMEVIRQNQEIYIKQLKHGKIKDNKKYKEKNDKRKIEESLAVKNLKRNRKKYLSATISIVISIVLLIITTSTVNYIFQITDEMYPNKYNIDTSFYSDAFDIPYKEKIETFEQISQLDNIEKYSIYTFFTGKIKRDRNVLTNEAYNLNCDINISIYSAEGTAFNKYLEELGLNYFDVLNKAILVNNFKTSYTSVEEIQLTNLKEGEKIQVNIRDKDYTFEIAKVTDKYPEKLLQTLDENSSMKMTGINAVLIIPMEVAKTIDVENSKIVIDGMTNMRINSSNPNKLEEDIEKYINEPKLNIINYSKMKEDRENMTNLISIFAYGLIIIIGVIGLTNIINTITTNINERKGEFKILSSIGMTSKQLKKMLRYESILYSIKAVLIGVIIGLLIAFIMYLIFSNSYELTFYIPIIQIIIACVIVISVTYMGARVKK